ncbi:hypothetical protein BCR33DRAFT_714175 [Rhizoclosmatium globosum]|uniref:Uncharacterized protein n=1 Tax=Rhizoclosmatium globosum TaxID=329046 RepID=A0A1Y2CQ05_9FUNG|nr:hypothetical protein BCR33DRAFT_714175 [Rhizoclosmatium globosum]|eukprot:ORY49121.1 hypothetical protein BCR33DRAFT_714175 [Rhizoclosmatium globosum]
MHSELNSKDPAGMAKHRHQQQLHLTQEHQQSEHQSHSSPNQRAVSNALSPNTVGYDSKAAKRNQSDARDPRSSHAIAAFGRQLANVGNTPPALNVNTTLHGTYAKSLCVDDVRRQSCLDCLVFFLCVVAVKLILMFNV